MHRYQIRVPADQVITDVIDLLALRAKEVLEAWQVFNSKLSPQDDRLFKTAICNHLTPFIRSYHLCGVSNICLDQTSAASWSPESHPPDPAPPDTVYQFFPRKELDLFLEDLAAGAFESIRCSLKPGMEQGVLSSLRIVFRCVLGDYLYFNPLCGHTELCRCSVAAHSTPWWHKADQKN